MNVYYLSLKPEIPANDYWAYGFLNDFIDGNMWQPPSFPEFNKIETDRLSVVDKAIVVIPGEYHDNKVKEINSELSKIGHVVLFIMADEGANFPVDKIVHHSIDIWVQYPWPGKHDQYNKLGTGYPPISQTLIPQMNPCGKIMDSYFSGQITHERRKQAYDELTKRDPKKNYALGTEGFTQGVKPKTYYTEMIHAKFAPAPAGTLTPDSFRVFEALECMTIPLSDERNSSGTVEHYWDWLFGQIVPLPLISDWSTVNDVITKLLQGWPANMHEMTAWWINEKRKFAYKVCEQLS